MNFLIDAARNQFNDKSVDGAMEQRGPSQPASGSQEDRGGQQTSDDATTRQRQRLFNSAKTAIFVIGTAAIVLIAFRNTVTWHLQRFWGASGDLWQLLWNPVFDLFNGDPWSMGVNGTAIVTVSAFWGFNLLFIAFDLGFGPTKWLKRYKIQDNEKVDPKRILKALPRILFNQFVVGYVAITIGYYIAQWRGCSFERQLPTFHRVVFEMFVFIWVEEI
uniref:Uncharacterized protein n=1 Tax=Plectus sambesii TaxID=2011161 RepID=A0A914V134_9BILA